MKPIETLDKILGNTIKIRILRHLATGYEARTGRALADIAKVSQPAVLKPLRELEEQGIVAKAIVGKGHSYSLNQKNILVTEGLLPLFRLEADLLQRFATALKEGLSYEIDSAVLFGTVARGVATHQSDWDVLLLCPSSKTTKQIMQELPDKISEWATKFSSNIDIKTMTTDAFKKKFLSGDTFVHNIYQDFINSRVQNPLFGQSLTELLKKQK